MFLPSIKYSGHSQIFWLLSVVDNAIARSGLMEARFSEGFYSYSKILLGKCF